MIRALYAAQCFCQLVGGSGEFGRRKPAYSLMQRILHHAPRHDTVVNTGNTRRVTHRRYQGRSVQLSRSRTLGIAPIGGMPESLSDQAEFRTPHTGWCSLHQRRSPASGQQCCHRSGRRATGQRGVHHNSPLSLTPYATFELADTQKCSRRSRPTGGCECDSGDTPLKNRVPIGGQ